jgi:predicted peptidase
MLLRIAAVVFLLPAALFAKDIAGKVFEGVLEPLTKKGDPLVYAVYAARSYKGKKPVPLVIAIHGGRGNARHFATFLKPLAESQGAILVCPQGFEEIAGADGYWWQGNRTEMAALDRLLAHARKRFKVDPERITLVGLADGAELGMRWALGKDRGLQGVIALNFLWKLKGTLKAPKELKLVFFASRDAKEKTASLKKHAEKATKVVRNAKYPVVLRIMPSSSKSFFHRWDEEFRKAYEWFDGKRDWPKELAPPPKKK